MTMKKRIHLFVVTLFVLAVGCSEPYEVCKDDPATSQCMEEERAEFQLSDIFDLIFDTLEFLIG